jgi:hypothetical protein
MTATPSHRKKGRVLSKCGIARPFPAALVSQRLITGKKRASFVEVRHCRAASRHLGPHNWNVHKPYNTSVANNGRFHAFDNFVWT